MKTVKIVLDKMESINKFVKIVSRYPFDIDLRSNRYVIDAKSLLGVCSLDTSKPVTMEIHSDNVGQLLVELDSFLAKD